MNEDKDAPEGNAGSLNVLLVEDNPGDARLFEELLEESRVEATFRHETRLEAGLSALGEEHPDVIVVDLGLPDSEGPATVRRVASAAPLLPIVVLTGRGELEVALQAQEAGAAEYLQKEELTPGLVGRTLRWAVERRQMHAKLRQRDAWIRSITESIAAGIFRAGPTGRIRYANEALTRMLGFARKEEMIGRDLTTFYADPSQRGRMLAAEGADGAEVVFERQDGSELVGLLSAEAAYRESGEVLHYDGVLTEITERKEAESRLRVLSEAVDQAKEAVLITEAEPLEEPGPRVVYANEAFEKMSGYSEEEILGKTPRILQGPETDREVLDSLREALEAREPWQGSAVNYRKDGTPYVVQWNVAPVRGEEGSVEYWVSLQQDVTEERKREERMAQMAQALGQVGDKVFITDREGRIQYVNEAFEEITGYSEEEVVGKTPAVLQSGEQDEAFYEELWETIQSGEAFRAEFVNEKKDGTLYAEDEHISPVADEEGEITHFVSCGRDITEQKKREETLRQQRNLLEQAQRLAGAWEVDLRSGKLSWSEEVYRIHEVEPDAEIEVGDGIAFYAPEARPEIREAFERCVEEGKPYDLELPLITAEGNRRWVRTVGAPSETENGEVVKVAGAVQDITDRKEAERALKRSEELHRATLSNITDTVLLTQADGTFSYVCPNVSYIFGYDEEEVEALGSISALLGSDPAEEHDFEGAQEISNVEHSVVDASGDRHDLLINVRRVAIQDGRRMYTCRDITERKQAEEALRERETQLRGLANSIPGVVFQAYARPGREYGFYLVSEHAEDLLGISEEPEGFFERCMSRVPEPERERLLEVIERAVDREELLQFEAPFVRPSGETIWLLGTATPERREEELVYNGVILDITERKEQEKRRKQVIERVTDAIVEVNSKWRFTLLNEEAEALYDTKEEKLLGEHFWDVFSEAQGTRFEDKYRGVMKTREPTRFEEYYSGLDGWFDVQVYPNDDGGVAFYFEETTERKRRERELETVSARLQLALESTGTGVFDWDLTTGEVIWDETSERLFGFEPGGFSGYDSWAERLHPDDLAPTEKEIEDAIENGETLDTEYRVTPPDGKQRWIRARGEVEYEDDEPARMIGIHTDVTERKRREQVLKERQEKVERLYTAADRLLRAETRQEISTSILNLVNEVFGYPIVTIRLIQDGQFIPVKTSPEVSEYMPERPAFDVEGDSVVAEGFRKEETMVVDDLRAFDDPYDYGEVRATAIVSMGSYGTISVADLEVGTIEDFDLRLIEILSTYAAIVIDRINREQDLVVAKEEAEEASRLKSTMLANMSHEIRTPLTAINGFTELLMEELSGPPADMAERAHRGGKRLMKTLNSVLELSQLEAGTYDLDLEKIDLREMVEGAVGLLASRAEENGVSLDAVYDSDPVGAWNDAGLNRICENLIGNAIKFTPEGGQVTVRVREEAGEAVLEVEDTGVGISEEALPDIFEAFKQESEGIAREFEGAGLGLSVVRRLTEAMEGTIDVDTEKGVGTCFTVRLPKRQGEE